MDCVVAAISPLQGCTTKLTRCLYGRVVLDEPYLYGMNHDKNVFRFPACASAMPFRNIGTNDKCCRKVALLTYTERLKFRFQSCNSASKQKHTENWALSCHPGDNGHVTH